MPTHDYFVANGTGEAVRADINLALSAIVSLNSNASEPGTMYAYQLWADTGNNLLKIRNSTNSAWITLRQLDGDFSIVAVEDGLLATPSLTFTNDLNTGVFRSGADALAVVTGGQYAIACTSTQAVGIKTANPSTTLHVAGNARVGADDVTDAHLQIGKGATGNRNSYIDIVGDTTYTDYGVRFIRNNTGANATSEIKHRGTGAFNIVAQEAAPIEFYTTNSPRLTITSGGLVGIGTSSPNYELHVNASDATNFIQLTNSGTGTGVSDGFLLYNNGVNATVSNQEAGYLSLETSGQARLHILSDGKVGIGTGFTPHATFQVHDGTFVLSKPATGSERNWRIICSDAVAGDLSFSQSTTAGGTTYATKVTVGATGNVGIGTTSPNQLLQINSTSVDARIQLSNSVSGSTNNDGFMLQWNSNDIFFDNKESGNFIFQSGANEAARIDSSRRLLVGTIASPAHQLQVSTDSAGKPSTNTWTIVSDERIKEEIELADLDLCYEAVKSIPLKRFKWKDEVYTEEQVRDRRKLGWIAQDVEAVFPKAVGTYEFKYNQVFEETIIPAIEEELDDEGNVTTPAQPERIEKGELISEDVIEDCRDLNSDQLYAAMYGAIQKLMVKVEVLEIEVAALKAS